MIDVNDKAPEFTLKDMDGNEYSLSSLLSKNKVILYFYPKDSTSGCTAEACSLRDGQSELKKLGYTIVGISPDGASSHKKFVEKYSLPFVLLSDEDHVVSESYGTWGLKKLYGREYMGMLRKTFLIDQSGTVTHVFNKVDTKNHFEQILKTIL